jgi:hypothetical protein
MVKLKRFGSYLRSLKFRYLIKNISKVGKFQNTDIATDNFKHIGRQTKSYSLNY